MKNKCPICLSNNNHNVYNQSNTVLARYGFLNKKPKTSSNKSDLYLNINYCNNCDFAWNQAFEYSKVSYDSDAIIESGTFSKRYLKYQSDKASYIKKVIGYKPDVLVEIGAGSGLFIKEFEAKQKIAIEPSEEAKLIDKSITVFNDFYKREKFNFKADLIVLRQVIEHVNNPLEFLNDIILSFNKKENKEFFIYIEVPNSTPTFRYGRFYDLYFEHCNYFTNKSLIFLATQLGMEVVDISTGMDAELLSVLLRIGPNDSSIVKSNLNQNKKILDEKIKKNIKSNKKIIAWGASGNGVQILNSLKIDCETIKYVIDSDINKQGKFVPVTFQEIISPKDAVKENPDIIIILSQFHKKEISEQCKRLFKNIDIWSL